MFASTQVDPAVLAAHRSQDGRTLAEFCNGNFVFLVFLRHFGCTFCREAVAEIAQKRSSIEARGVSLAFVHLGTEEKAQWFFTHYGLTDVPRFGDPEAHLYQAFGLSRAKLGQYLNPESIRRSIGAFFHGHFIGFPAGEIERMPGVFLMQGTEIRKSFRHQLVSDRPDYLALANPA
jgi:peroxiredoxin